MPEEESQAPEQEMDAGEDAAQEDPDAEVSAEDAEGSAQAEQDADAEVSQTGDDADDADAVEGGQGAPKPMKLDEFTSSESAADASGIDLLMDVDLDVKIELGRAEMAIEDVLKLRKGSVVELDKLAGDPVDILVNGRAVAKGEILVVNDNFCVRITAIVDPAAGLRFEDESDE